MFLLLSVGASQSASSERDAGRSPPSCLLGTASLGDDWWSCASRSPGLPCCTSCWCLLLTGVTLPPPSPVPWPTRFLAAGRASGCAPMTGSWLCVPSESPSSPSSLQLVLWGSGLIRSLAVRQGLLPVTQTPLHHQGELRGWGRSLLSWGLVLWESISLSHQPFLG